jgi:Histidine kinase-, DNA gyrase B-, and HSP90-like ATPase
LGNAVKFTETGYILVKSQVEEQPRNAAGKLFKVLITVEDTVCFKQFHDLISREWGSHRISSNCKFLRQFPTHHRLFRAFSQLDNSNKRSYGGTGLGLAICEKVTSCEDTTEDSL